MDPKLSSPSANFLPAQLLHQKLLSYQQDADESWGNNKPQAFSSTADPNTLYQLSLLGSSLDNPDNHSTEGDDDDDVTIPGKAILSRAFYHGDSIVQDEKDFLEN